MSGDKRNKQQWEGGDRGGQIPPHSIRELTLSCFSVLMKVPPPALCSVSFSDPEGYIDSNDYPPLLLNNFLECTYNVTVYTGYGVELQVKSVNLSEGELLSIRGVDGPTLTVLANQTLLVEGQVIRSPTNTISIYFRTFQEDGLGTFQLHYQAFMLSCNFPRRPDFGDVTVMDLHSGGVAHFHCHLGYELQGTKTLTCINASKPHWSSPEPICSAPCGGAVHNATIGRVLSPSYPGNTNGSQVCVWTIEAPEGQKLHLHFERLSLNEKDRMVVYSGRTNKSALLYDSLQTESVPFEGLLSDGNTINIEFTSDQARVTSVFNIRFEAFEKGHCYEPYIQNGNFTTSDLTYNIGTIVEFTCDPGHSLEQGPAIIECINVRDPYWNDTEPLCRAMCGGELSAVAGVVLSPNWPEPYVEGEDCVWKIHVGEEKRIFLDIQLLNLSNSDILTIYDGDEVMPHILGQYLGNSGPQKLYSSTPDLTIQFHSDPAGLIFGKGQGFIMNYIEVSRNDSCSDLPEIQNGWKTTSHTELVRGARITYQCDPGYDIVGSDTLTCQWDLSWSSDPPFCEKIMYCTDPGEVDHSTRLISDPVLLVGTTIQYTCNPGFVLEGSSLLTCYSRETGTPIWTSRLPHCVSEESLACDNPGLPENGYQILYKRLYLPGESLTFMCYEGFELMGEVTIRCILGQPSHWNGPLPVCKVNQDSFEHALEAEAAAETSLEGGNMALAIFIPVLIISLLLGGAYIYITRCRYYSNLRLPLMYSHPYSQITVETEFDNPIYETGVSWSLFSLWRPPPRGGAARGIVGVVVPASRGAQRGVCTGGRTGSSWTPAAWAGQQLAVAPRHGQGASARPRLRPSVSPRPLHQPPSPAHPGAGKQRLRGWPGREGGGAGPGGLGGGGAQRLQARIVPIQQRRAEDAPGRRRPASRTGQGPCSEALYKGRAPPPSLCSRSGPGISRPFASHPPPLCPIAIVSPSHEVTPPPPLVTLLFGEPPECCLWRSTDHSCQLGQFVGKRQSPMPRKPELNELSGEARDRKQGAVTPQARAVFLLYRRCLLFDDSFLHTAFHEGSAEDGPRVVFMVDLWHPNVAAAERQALDFIFAPGR
ncbi:seizure 6-like protein [Trichechus manatus latirostris]|uniref:Seizure 6-like protein n=1 Tax=Trichechus manatus latirostris TaxID=127582 RepID=A0A2Y9RVE2_TRIMA|nr:seizure 6-like protein [Trichechus manatus latirostris]